MVRSCSNVEVLIGLFLITLYIRCLSFNDDYDFVEWIQNDVFNHFLHSSWNDSYPKREWIPFSNYDFQLWSAFWDLRQVNKPLIRVLLNKRRLKKYKANCIVTLENNETVVLVGNFQLLHVDADQFYEPAFLLCSWSNRIRFKPLTVGIEVEGNVSKSLIVNLVFVPEKRPYFLTVCLSPLHHFQDWLRLITFVQFYRTLGVSKIIVYVHDTSTDVKNVLEYYEKMKLISTIEMLDHSSHPDFDPRGKQDLLHYYGQRIQIHDCFMRMTPFTQFWADFDVDEFIGNSETKENFLVDLISKISENKNIGGIQIRSRFWNKEWQLENSLSNMEIEQIENLSLFSSFQVSKLYPTGIRSKMILKPETVERKIIHSVSQYFPPIRYRERILAESEAVVYHLRFKKEKKQIYEKNVQPFKKLGYSISRKILNVINKLSI